MTERLKAAIAEAEKLSEEDQNAVAEAWLLLLDERGWERRFANPQNQLKMQRMAEEALQEYAAGKTEEWP